MLGNQIRTTLLLGLLTGVLLFFGGLIGGRGGMMFAFFLAAVLNFGSYWFSDRIVLSMYQAREVSPGQAPQLYEIVQRLARRAELPTPRVYIIPKDAPNAFATGRNPDHAVVAVTEGLLDRMDSDELAGVLAHELAHVKDRDILIGSIAATLAGAIMMLANMARWSAIFGGFGGDDDGPGILGLLLTSILAPVAAILVQMGISRSREYLADQEGAKIAGSSEGLARALEKLGADSGRLKANPATSHLFIVNPLSGGGLRTLFSTHPPLEERIARLRGRKPAQEASRSGSGDRDPMAGGGNPWERLR
jgi:heat shock protein HtpX